MSDARLEPAMIVCMEDRRLNSFNSICDDFGISMYLASKVPMTQSRESIIHFFETVQKKHPKLRDFDKREENEYTLEGDRENGIYQWVTLDPRRLGAGSVNPAQLDDADLLNEGLLEMAPYYLGFSNLDADALDVVYYFDLMYAGNHDEVVAEALALNGPFESVMKTPENKVLQYQPSVLFSLDEHCQTQCRLSIETRSTAYQVRTRHFVESPISVYCTVRQFWGRQSPGSFMESYHLQRKLIDEIVVDHVVPNIVQPLAKTIAAK
jgi:hypothetical protein